MFSFQRNHSVLRCDLVIPMYTLHAEYFFRLLSRININAITEKKDCREICKLMIGIARARFIRVHVYPRPHEKFIYHKRKSDRALWRAQTRAIFRTAEWKNERPPRVRILVSRARAAVENHVCFIIIIIGGGTATADARVFVLRGEQERERENKEKRQACVT